MRALILACVLALCASPLAADAYYDVGSNTTFATFQAALSQALADHPGPLAVTVCVRALDANLPPQSVDLDAGLLPFQPQPGHRLVLESAPGLQAVLSGSGNYGIQVSGVANVTIQSLDVEGFSLSGLRLDNAADAQVLNSVFNGAGTAGVEAHGCVGLRVSDCSLAPLAGSGVLVDGGSQALVSDNTVPATAGISYGFVMQYSDAGDLDRNRADGADYAFNVFSCSAVTVNANVAIARGQQRGLVLDNAPLALVSRNLLVGQDVGVELQSSTGCALVQNTVWEHATAALYAHNSSQPLWIRNNLWNGFLCYFLDAATQAGISSNNNGFYFDAQLGVGSGSYADLAAWQAAGQDAGSVQTDPLFVTLNATQPAGFKLQPGSPVLGFGTDLSSLLSTDYFGNYLYPAPSPWDPGFHVESVAQNTPTVTPTPTPILPTATPTATPTPSITATFTPSPVGTATPTPTISPTPTITATYTLTPYPFRAGRVLSYPNPWSPYKGGLNIVFEPTDQAGVRIFDMAGELVIDLPGNDIQASLGHATWDGKDSDGRPVPSGLYLFVVSTPQGTKFSRFTVLY